MGNSNMKILPMTPTIGAEIHGADLARDLGNQTFQEIHDSLMRHQVLFFRNQEMDLSRKSAGYLSHLHCHRFKRERAFPA